MRRQDSQDSEGVVAAARSASAPTLAASALVAFEGLVMIGLGLLQIVRGVGTDIDDPWRAELGGVLALVFGAAGCLLARALLRRRPWARSPTIVVQLLCLPVAVGLLQGGLYGYGVPLIAVPVAILVLLAASARG